ncbi:MAG: hypothetical protein COC00_010485 [Rhizobiales bacterium]|nr:hypothetical protein [Hyphomicrobiales bacterium]
MQKETTIDENDPRWLSVLARENLGVPPFLYAVKTMGIYCLIGCSSRAPLLKNVEFFDLPEQAEQAGHRACKKCKPNQNWKSHTLKVLGLFK